MSHGYQWTPEQIQTLTALYPDTKSARIAEQLGVSLSLVYRKANQLGLHKSEAFLASEECGRLKKADGTRTWFRKGHVAWNKGLKLPGHGCKRTQFQKGSLSGRAKQIYQPIGAERTSKDGYLQRKVNNDLPMQQRWRGVHVINWEAANGPIPKSHVVCFKDGNKQNVALDNLELVSRIDLMQRNTVHNYPPEIAQLVQLRGALNRKINAIKGKSK